MTKRTAAPRFRTRRSNAKRMTNLTLVKTGPIEKSTLEKLKRTRWVRSAKQRILDCEVHLICATKLLETLDDVFHSGTEVQIDSLAARMIAAAQQQVVVAKNKLELT